ncbi:DUF1624 domain-containing protein [Alloscardovia criceti]|uniref:DUF1624 domain-containing protein n=1 Tax=Alloscardovia criceti TaxID=356828 RepID=UPI000372B97B|nr:heparan-alpha-glucosaminide N-acetyltransferase domain-containing protein [Alloscardovia criceti]
MTIRERYHLIDVLRGVAIVNMVAFHALWDVVNSAYVAPSPALLEFANSTGVYVWQQSIGFLFIFLAGFCFSFGSRPLVRGLQLVLWGELISLITYAVMPAEPVRFGVLTLIGLGMLILSLINAWTQKISALGAGLTAVVSLGLYAFLHDAQTGVIWSLRLSHAWYRNAFTALLGFPPDGFIASDYYPLIPFFFVMLAGYMTYRLMSALSVLKFLSMPWHNPVYRAFEFLGRHSLLIYLVHQIVLFIGINAALYIISAS